MNIAKVFAVLILAGIFMLMSGCSEDNLTDIEYVQRAKEYLDEGNLPSGAIQLKNALQQNPDNAEARMLLGEISVELGDGTAAEKELRRAVQLGVTPEAVALSLTRALLLQEKWNELLTMNLDLERLEDDVRAELFTLRGIAQLAKGMNKEATEEFKLALEAKEDSAAALLGQAFMAMQNRQWEDARRWNEKALEADPTFADAWSLMGDLERQAGDLAKAEEAFGKAIELRRYFTMDRIKRAWVRLLMDNLADAEEDIGVLKKAGLKHPILSYVEGRILFQQEKYNDARYAFEASLKMDSAYLPAKLYLATTHLIQGHLEQALSLAEQLYQEAPYSQRVRHLLSAIRFNRSEFTQAKTVLEETLNQSPDDARALYLLGNIALLEGQAADGVGYFQKVAALEPDSDQARSMLQIAKLMDGQDVEGTPFTESADENEAARYEQDFLFALNQFRRGNYRIALDLARKLHENNPDKVDPLNLMAACHLALGEWDEARKELNKVLEIDSVNPSAIRNLAKVESAEGNLDQAIDLLERLLTENPGDPEAATLLAEIESRRGNDEKVMQVLARAVESNPDESEMHAMLAQKYFQAGRLAELLALTRDLSDQQVKEQPSLLEFKGKAESLSGDVAAAERTFSRLVEILPDSVQARFFYAESLARNRKLDRAWEELKRALEIDPNYLPARIGEIKWLAQFEGKEQAMEALAAVKQDFGDRPEVLGIEGWLAFSYGDFATAEESFAAAVKQKPDTELTLSWVKALWGQEKYDEALQVMQAWLEDHPRDIPVLLHLAGGYLTLNQEAKARTMYEKVVELQPNHLPALNNLAWLSRDDDLDKAIAYAEEAHALAPNDPYVLDTFGMLLLKSGDDSRGISLLQQAADLAPQDPEIQLHLGRALVENKEFARAKRVLDTMLTNSPDSPFADEAKELLESIPR